ncbi:ArsR/SmtB family transcription factor [Pelagibius sp.]|uniref:ArsR/SmtB family transcription factor n=1 Tax=Pelagibius sp. TaxID=1931238 RepID=UPI003B5068B0
MQTIESDAVFHAIADRTRRRLLELLAEGERPVQDLAAEFDMSFAAVSQHLQILRAAGLVRRRPAGRKRIYALEPAPLAEVRAWTDQYERFWKARLARLRRHLATKPAAKPAAKDETP